MPSGAVNAPAGGGHRRSVRTAVLERLLGRIVDEQVDRVGRRELDVLDAGGGTGIVAVPLAEAGHRVTVVDPSPDSLAALERRAAEAGVTSRIRAVQGGVCELTDVVAAGAADLVLCHNVLEVVDEPGRAIVAIADAARAGAALSLVVANRYASVLARALGGHLRSAHAALVADPAPSETRRFTVPELTDLLTPAGFRLTAVHGIGVFADLVHEPGDHPEGGLEALLTLEGAAADHPVFGGLGTNLHLHAVKGT